MALHAADGGKGGEAVAVAGTLFLDLAGWRAGRAVTRRCLREHVYPLLGSPNADAIASLQPCECAWVRELRAHVPVHPRADAWAGPAVALRPPEGAGAPEQDRLAQRRFFLRRTACSSATTARGWPKSWPTPGAARSRPLDV
jgi:hypothetical protein